MSFSSDSIYDCMISAPESLSEKIPARHYKKTAALGIALVSLFFVQFFAGSVVLPAADSTALPFGRSIKEISYISDLPLNRSHYDPFIGIKPGDILTRTGVKSAIQSLYDTGRFSSIVVDALPDGDAALLRFNLLHNYYFNTFSAEKLDLKGRFLWELASLPIGQRFTSERLEESRLSVLHLARNMGFYRAEIKALTKTDERSRQIDVVFVVQPGALASISSIEIGGIPPESEKKVRTLFGFHSGSKFDRSKLNARLDTIKRYFVKSGYLAAVASVGEHFDSESNAVALKLNVTGFGKMRVIVEGFTIEDEQLRRLLPALTGEGVTQEILEEGAKNLKEFLETKGYSETRIKIAETVDGSGVRIFSYQIAPGRKYTVSYVRFQGNTALSAKEILPSLELQPASFVQKAAYSIALLDNDVDAIKSLYEYRGYLAASVTPLTELTNKGKSIGITYDCQEGPLSKLNVLDISGNAAVPTKELLSRLRISPGSAYAPSRVEQERQSILSYYNDKGYLSAQVSVKIGVQQANSYSVAFAIDEGMQSIVDKIFVLGNENTRSSVIQKRISLKEEAPLSLGKLLETQQSLYSLGIFDQAKVLPQNPDSSSPYQNVVVRLQESQRYTFRYGFGYQEREKLRGTLELSKLNVFGSARRADIRLRGSSIEQQAIFSLQQPQFRALQVDSYFTFSALQRRDVSFDSKRLNLSYQFSHPFSDHTWAMLRYTFKNVRISNSQVQPSELGREDQPINLSTFSAALVRDTRDNYLDPTVGFFSSTDFGVTPGLWDDHEYFTFFTQNSMYRKLPRSLMFAASVRFGATHPFSGSPDVPISERFFAGGGSSLRGFDTDYAGPLDSISFKPVGGNALFIGSAEIRIPIFSFISLAGFYDSGNVFRQLGEMRPSGFSHTVGSGLRIKTPFGPLRADYGYNLNLSTDQRLNGLHRGHLFITIGPPF